MGHILKSHEILDLDFVRAENCCLFDDRGRRYVDFESGTWATALGHRHPRIDRVLHEQVDRVAHLGARYPVSAVAMRRGVATASEEGGFLHAQSHQNDPLGCAVASEVIAVLREEAWVERGEATGAFFLDGLQRLAERHAVVKEARGRGMLLGLELQPQVAARSLHRSLLEHGFVVGYHPAGNVLRFDPALTMDRGHIAELLEWMDSILGEAGTESG